MTNIIEQKLHHRSPYLMIDKIIDSSTDMIRTQKIPNLNEFYLQGHFPNSPVVPGAMMQEMTTQSAGLLITLFHSPVENYDSERTKGYALGVLRAVHFAKFKKFARPGDILTVTVELIEKNNHSFRFKAKIECENEKIMSNEFTLINISEEQLQG
jgi:3-hydroxyacyl-[acyl-carrier-protein] dehydratase